MAWDALIWSSTALVSALVVFTRQGWYYARHGATLTHELGHAIIGSLTFAKVSGIHLNMDSSGHTRSARAVRVFPLGAIASTFSGYPFPILMGSVIMAMLISGNIMAALWTVIAMGAVTLIFIRNIFGLVVTLSWVALAGLCFYYPPLAPWYTTLIAFVLVFAGFKDLAMLYRIQKYDDEESTDLHVLKYYSHFPRMFWYGLMWTVSALYLVIPGYTLLAVVDM